MVSHQLDENPGSPLVQDRFAATGASVSVFHYRTGRAIALSRFVLASVFLLAIYIDPSQPATAPDRVYLFLSFYVATAAAATVVAWRSWWWDRRLATTMHWIDLVVFALVVFSTEGYTSPFFTFSLFLLFSTAMRWGGHETMRTAVAVNILFLIAGLTSGLLTAIEIDVQRLMIRATYLIVLSALCVWFTYDRDRLAVRSSLPTRLGRFLPDADLPQVICSHISARTAGQRVICILRDHEEPRVRLCQRGGDGDTLNPDDEKRICDLLDVMPAEPFLLDSRTARILVGSAQSAQASFAHERLNHFCTEHHLGALLGFVARTEDWECAVFISDLALITSDDLTTGAELAEEVAFLRRRAVVSLLSDQATLQRARLSIARDLHDSVAQIVAGVSFRLEGFKRSGKTAAELAPSFEVLQDELASEQVLLRSLIADLRQPNFPLETSELETHLTELANRLERQWGILCTVATHTKIRVSKSLEREINQMVREGVANAVRHGGADCVTVILRALDDQLMVEICDNGTGWSSTAPAFPRTLTERAEALGGTLDTDSSSERTIVRIALPAGAIG